MTSRIRHRPAPPRLWFGAQTAYTDIDWLKQLKRFAAGRFVFAETNSFETVLKLFCFSFSCADS